ncbi:MAG: hypothetical protein IKP58_00555 [Victivallales bacterium]|nr:hypothetical protein [Victivallales bacterium]
MKSFALLFLGFAIALSAQSLDMTTPMHGEVVYQENFDKTATLEGFTLFESRQWKIENGKLVHPVTGGMPQLLLPKATFGQDMAIQADVTIRQAANDMRWAGIFLRHLEDKAVFTHMPVRYNRATEIADAVIDANNHFNWRIYAPSYRPDGKPATATRTHRLEIRGNIARSFIDGKCVRFVFLDSSSVHPGRAGFSLSSVEVEIDNIVVEKLPPVSMEEKIAISKMYTSMPFVIAHRGFSEKFPENTLEAIKGALEAGADGVEIDARISKDGVVYCLHDDTLNRTTNGTGLAREKTIAELRELDAGAKFNPKFAGAKIALFEDVVKVVKEKDSVVLVDLKEAAAVDAICDILIKHKATRNALLDTGSPKIAQKYRSRIPDATVICITGVPGPRKNDFARSLKSSGFDALFAQFQSPFLLNLTDLRLQGLSIFFWTINNRNDVINAWKMGADGIITDRPTMVRETLDRIASKISDMDF